MKIEQLDNKQHDKLSDDTIIHEESLGHTLDNINREINEDEDAELL
jgi:hypothetical protein